MTDYEKLSLSLLAVIASGIGLQMTGEMGNKTLPEHKENVLAWNERMRDIMEAVARAVSKDK